jgi:hypothetical protein
MSCRRFDSFQFDIILLQRTFKPFAFRHAARRGEYAPDASLGPRRIGKVFLKVRRSARRVYDR